MQVSLLDSSWSPPSCSQENVGQGLTKYMAGSILSEDNFLSGGHSHTSDSMWDNNTALTSSEEVLTQVLYSGQELLVDSRDKLDYFSL